MTTWPLDPRTSRIVAQALAEHFTVKSCARCEGPEIFSKARPLARCFRCGTQRELEKVAPSAKRHQCRNCRKFFRAVWASLVCPTCIDKRDRAAVKERKRSRPRKPTLKSPMFVPEMQDDGLRSTCTGGPPSVEAPNQTLTEAADSGRAEDPK